MTPKKYAEKLSEEFLNIKHVKLNDYSVIEWPTAKRCALITINELIRTSPWGGEMDEQIENDSKEFYIKAKEELVNI